VRLQKTLGRANASSQSGTSANRTELATDSTSKSYELRNNKESGKRPFLYNLFYNSIVVAVTVTETDSRRNRSARTLAESISV
jgi:hypothetical protein